MDSHNTLYGRIYGDGNGAFSIVCNCCDLRLNKLSQLREHVSKQKTIAGPELPIPTLPVECLEKIFGYLAPNHLVNVSQVSREFKAIVEKVFTLYFDPGPIEIHYKQYKQYWNAFVRRNFVYKSRYEVAFRSLVRRVNVPYITWQIGGGYENFFLFIRENCAEKLVSLNFHDNDLPLSYDGLGVEEGDQNIYGEIAKDQLKHLQYLRVKNLPCEHLYEQLLQFTENLKTLIVISRCRSPCFESKVCLHFTGAWTQQTFPKLETIYLHTIDDWFDLMPMIRRHPKLRNVACNSTETIRSIIRSDIKFNFIGMIFLPSDDGYRRLIELHGDIVKFGRAKNFQTFELCLSSEVWHQSGNIDAKILRYVEKIPNLTGLHGFFDIVRNRGVVRFPLIEKLCMFYYGSCDSLIPDMDIQFPNLKELRLNARDNERSENGPNANASEKLFRVILHDSQVFKNLERFHYENDTLLSFTWDDVVDINFVRSKRTNPSKLTVYVDPQHFHTFNSNVVELQFIEIKPWVHGGCDLCVHCDTTL